MNNRPLPNPNDLYPDSTERAKNMLEEQKKAHEKASFQTIIWVVIILAILVGGGYLVYTSGIFNKTKNTVSNQINDSLVRNDVSRAKTVSAYYYRSYKSYEGMGDDIDYKAVVNEVAGHGAELHLQGTSETTFVSWTILPQNKEYYCADATGFTGKIDSIDPNQTTCK